MSVFKAFFGLGKIPQVVKFFEFQSFDDVNKMGGAIRALKEQARMSGTQLTKAQERYLDDQMKQVEMVFEQMQQPSTQSGIRSTKSAKIFDLQGNKIDPNKPIMGGTQEIDKAIDNASPGFAGDRKYDAQLVADDLANKRFGKDFYDLDEIDQMKLYDEAYQGLSKQRFLDKELMKTDNPFSDLVKTTEKGPKGIKEREAEILERMNKSNKKNVGIIKRRKMREEISKVNDQIEEMIESGVNENNPELAKLYDKQNDLELKLDFEDMMSPDPEDMAQGGRAGFVAGGITNLAARLARGFMKVTGRKPNDEEFIKIIREAAERDFAEVSDDVALRGVSETRATARRMDSINKDELRKVIDEYNMPVKTQKEFDFAQGGRAGFSDGTPDKKITIDVAGSKFGKQQIPGAPKGITMDEESINAIIKADIPISQKIDLLAKYQYGKGRTRIEKDNQEISLDEGGFKSRDIGLGFNKDGEGIGGTLMYNMETGKPEFNIGFKKSFADGGRAGFKEGSGMTRRSFLKILGGLAAIPIVGKFLKPLKTAKGIKSVPIIKTDNVPGKPEWFDALVNKVIIEGDDVTKRFATGERQSIHQKTLDDGSVVRVTEDVDDGAVRVEYESVDNMYEDPVQMQYKKPLPDEGAPNPSAEFDVAESGPVGRAQGPDDFDIDIDEVGGQSISDLSSDVSKLKQYATGKEPTMKEIVEIKKRKDKVKAITSDSAAEAEEVIRRQGDYDPFASGGIARMLGE